MSTTFLNKKPNASPNSGQLARRYEFPFNNFNTKTSKEVINNTSDEKLYSLDNIKSISGNDMIFVTKIIALFGSLAQEAIVKMRDAYNCRDIAQIKLLAHKIKPNLDSLEVKIVYKEIRELESLDISNFEIVYVGRLVNYVIEKLELLLNDLKKNQLL